MTHNVSKNDRDHGLFFNYANYSDIHRNVVKNSDNECLFIYNANFNKFHENLFESCQIGVHFTAGSERNEIHENGFVNNRIQVKYVGTRWLDWSEKGRGNYWSDNAAFDLDGDGISDTAYRPNDELILWSVPAAKILANSPSVQLIRWAQSVFPALQTGGVIDTAPLMRPPHVESPKAFSRTR